MSRRSFLVGAAASVAALSAPPGGYKGPICFFSKHLPGMDGRRLGRSLKRAGFAGVDLTVRKGGHVAPEKVAEDLPTMVAAIRAEGLEVPMITTELLSAREPTARPIFAAAGKLSIPYLKPGYYKYEFVDVRKELENASREFRGLVELAKEFHVQVGYHNHVGELGAPVWDIAEMLRDLDPKWAGFYFDVCHAVAEGGVAGWKVALNLAAPRLKMVAIKDFFWEKTAKGWRRRYCPLGEGMVDWKYYFQALARTGFEGPISLHLEYEIQGSTPAAKEENTLAAAQKDLEFVRSQLSAVR